MGLWTVVGLLVLLAAAAATAAVVRGVMLGYPPGPLAGSMLSAKEQAIIGTCADAMLPAGGSLPLSGTQAGVVAHFDAMVRGVPPPTRSLVRLLLYFVEHGPWLFGMRARLTRQSPDARVHTLRSWSRSPFYLLRISFMSLRTLLTMAYVANAAVAARMGSPGPRAPRERGAAA